MKKFIDLAGITPTKFGPNPLNNDDAPSLIYIPLNTDPVSLKCCHAWIIGFPDLGILLYIEWYTSDCNLVLTTSNGHVTTAPTVPPIPPATKCTHGLGLGFGFSLVVVLILLTLSSFCCDSLVVAMETSGLMPLSRSSAVLKVEDFSSDAKNG